MDAGTGTGYSALVNKQMLHVDSEFGTHTTRNRLLDIYIDVSWLPNQVGAGLHTLRKSTASLSESPPSSSIWSLVSYRSGRPAMADPASHKSCQVF